MSERDELVARLNRADEYEPLGHDGWQAANQIERDGREIERLRGALEDIHDGEPEWPDEPEKELIWCRDRARAALNGEGET